MTKSLWQRLLMAGVRAVLRRREAPGAAQSGNILKRGDLELDPQRHSCHWKGNAVDLTVTEFLLLQALARRPGHVKNRDQLIDEAYGQNVYVDDRTIDSHIKRIRRKFREHDPEFSEVETLYGVGYRYRTG